MYIYIYYIVLISDYDGITVMVKKHLFPRYSGIMFIIKPIVFHTYQLWDKFHC